MIKMRELLFGEHRENHMFHFQIGAAGGGDGGEAITGIGDAGTDIGALTATGQTAAIGTDIVLALE